MARNRKNIFISASNTQTATRPGYEVSSPTMNPDEVIEKRAKKAGVVRIVLAQKEHQPCF